LCVYLVASNRSWPMADAPQQAASARVAALVAKIARHPDYQRLRTEMLTRRERGGRLRSSPPYGICEKVF